MNSDEPVTSFVEQSGLSSSAALRGQGPASPNVLKRILTIAGQVQFFISFHPEDEAWAYWIAWQLDSAGYTWTMGPRHAESGQSADAHIEQAQQAADCTLVVLSGRYARACADETADTHPGRISVPTGSIVVGVHHLNVVALHGAAYVDLAGRSERLARQELLARLQQEVDPAEAEPQVQSEAQPFPDLLNDAVPTLEVHDLHVPDTATPVRTRPKTPSHRKVLPDGNMDPTGLPLVPDQRTVLSELRAGLALLIGLAPLIYLSAAELRDDLTDIHWSMLALGCSILLVVAPLVLSRESVRLAYRLKSRSRALNLVAMCGLLGAVMSVPAFLDGGPRPPADLRGRTATARALAEASWTNSQSLAETTLQANRLATDSRLSLLLSLSAFSTFDATESQALVDQFRWGSRNQGLLGEHDVTAAFSPNGRLLASGSTDGAIAVWDVSRRVRLSTLHAGANVQAVAFSPDGRVLASGSTDGAINIWYREMSDWKNAASFDARPGTDLPLVSLAFSSRGTDLAMADLWGVTLWDYVADTHRAVLSNPDMSELVGAAFSADGSLLAAGSIDSAAVLWDVSGSTPQRIQ